MNGNRAWICKRMVWVIMMAELRFQLQLALEFHQINQLITNFSHVNQHIYIGLCFDKSLIPCPNFSSCFFFCMPIEFARFINNDVRIETTTNSWAKENNESIGGIEAIQYRFVLPSFDILIVIVYYSTSSKYENNWHCNAGRTIVVNRFLAANPVAKW